jgi:hypothetical protein
MWTFPTTTQLPIPFHVADEIL